MCCAQTFCEQNIDETKHVKLLKSLPDSGDQLIINLINKAANLFFAYNVNRLKTSTSVGRT